MTDRFTVEPRGTSFVVRDNNQPEGSPFKDGLIYITPSEKLATDHAAHCNRSTKP